MSSFFVEISHSNIYNGSASSFKFTATSQISITVSRQIQIIGLEAGVLEPISMDEQNSQRIISTTDKGMHHAKFLCQGVIAENRLTCAKDGGTVETYGMQYYPFVSSRICLDLEVSGAVCESVTLVFADAYRIPWFRKDASFLYNGQELAGSCSQGEKEILYAFSPRLNANKHGREELSRITIDTPIQIGGKELLRIATFPSYYFALTMFILAILASAERLNIVIGALTAFWIALLRTFNASSSPQFNTALRDIYTFLGLYALAWALIWEFTPSLRWVALVSGFCLVIIAGQVASRFKKEGRLPVYAERFLYWLRSRNETFLRRESLFR